MGVRKAKLVAESRIPFTKKQGYKEAAKQIRSAMSRLAVAKTVAPEGELANLPDLGPWAEAMDRAAESAVDDGTVFYPRLPLA